MATIKGEVFRVYEKPFKGKTLYTVKIDGDPIYYRMNEKRYAGIVEPGNTITFESEPIDQQSAKMTSAPELVKNVPAAVPAATGGASGGNAGLQMRYQGALERAIAFVDLATKTGALVLPKDQKKKVGYWRRGLTATRPSSTRIPTSSVRSLVNSKVRGQKPRLRPPRTRMTRSKAGELVR